MSHDSNHFDLTDQLNSFSISTQEDKLAQQLDKTHIASSHSIFSVPTFNQQPHHVNNSNNHNTTLNTSTSWETPQWDASQQQQQQQEDEGWGEGPPSYTSISQGTYFGFNSIMEASKVAGMPVADTPLSPAGEQAFGRFKNTPVTFTSAAAAFNANHESDNK